MNDIFEETTRHFEEVNAQLYADKMATRRRNIQIAEVAFALVLTALFFIFHAEIMDFVVLAVQYIIGGIVLLGLMMLIGIGGAAGSFAGLFSSKR